MKGKHISELNNWLEARGIPPLVLDMPESTQYSVLLESIEVSTVVCSLWHFVLDIELDDSENIRSYTLSETGTCL